MSAASTPASIGDAATETLGVGAGNFDTRDGASVCPPQALNSVSRAPSACVEVARGYAQKIRDFESDRRKFIFDRLRVAVGDTLPALA